MENLSVIGIGRLGLCFGLTLERGGYNIVGCDIRQEYVDSINDRTLDSFEPNVNEYLRASKNLSATTDLAATAEHADTMFVTVATYSELDGRYDVSQVDSVVLELLRLGYQEQRKHLVICSNVNPGYSNRVYEKLEPYNWDVSFNPEVVAQGTILHNQEFPDAVYVGSDTSELADSIVTIYKNVCSSNPVIHTMDRLSAELTKVSLNCYLTCKISFANMVGDLATKLGANPDKVLYAVGSDSRINNKFFKYGFGWGGPCFPRDTRAFIRLAKDNQMPHYMCHASNESNNSHLDFQVNRFMASKRKEYVTDCVTYKKGTLILEESQQLAFALELANRGVKVIVKETPEVTLILKEKYGDLFTYE